MKERVKTHLFSLSPLEGEGGEWRGCKRDIAEKNSTYGIFNSNSHNKAPPNLGYAYIPN